MSRRRFLIIHNPQAGTVRRGLLRSVLGQLTARGCITTVQTATDPQADRQLAAEAAKCGAYDTVVAAGGDSTMRSVAAGLLDTGVPLGLIPIGVGNVLAAEIGLARHPAAIARCLMDGPVRPAGTATANGEPFLLMAGAGYDAAVVAALSQPLKRWLGRAAYGWPILRNLGRPRPRLRVDVDGKRHEAAWAIVTNARRYAGSFSLSADSSIFSNGLTTVLFAPRSRAELAAQLMTLARGALAQAPRVTFLPSACTRIEADESVPVQIEGESFGATPLTVNTDSRTLSLLVPPAG